MRENNRLERNEENKIFDEEKKRIQSLYIRNLNACENKVTKNEFNLIIWSTTYFIFFA